MQEADAEQVEYFALVPVGAAPHGGDRFDRGIGAENPALQPHALLVFDGMEVIDHFEARLGGIAIDGRDGAEAHEFLVVFQKAADADDFGSGDLERQLAAIECADGDGVGVERLHRRSYGVLSQTFG